MASRGRFLLWAITFAAALPLPTAGHARPQSRQALGPVADGDETRHALIYVYRNAGWAGRALEPSVRLDEVELVTMDNKRYFSVWVEPGDHSLSAGGGKTRGCQPPLRESFESGKIYYVDIRLLEGGAGCFYPMTVPNAAFARDQISKLKPLDPDNVKHPAVRRK